MSISTIGRSGVRKTEPSDSESYISTYSTSYRPLGGVRRLLNSRDSGVPRSGAVSSPHHDERNGTKSPDSRPVSRGYRSMSVESIPVRSTSGKPFNKAELGPPAPQVYRQYNHPVRGSNSSIVVSARPQSTTPAPRIIIDRTPVGAWQHEVLPSGPTDLKSRQNELPPSRLSELSSLQHEVAPSGPTELQIWQHDVTPSRPGESSLAVSNANQQQYQIQVSRQPMINSADLDANRRSLPIDYVSTLRTRVNDLRRGYNPAVSIHNSDNTGTPSWQKVPITSSYSPNVSIVNDQAARPFGSPTDFHQMFSQIARINDHLYLSSLSAITPERLKQYQITLLVSAMMDTPPIPLRNSVAQSMHVAVEDMESANLRPHFDRVADRIASERRRNGRVLVHCMAGVSRSSSLVMAYLIRHMNMSLADAYSLVRSIRPCIQPNPSFWRQLLEYEERVRGGRSIRLLPPAGSSSSHRSTGGASMFPSTVSRYTPSRHSRPLYPVGSSEMILPYRSNNHITNGSAPMVRSSNAVEFVPIDQEAVRRSILRNESIRQTLGYY